MLNELQLQAHYTGIGGSMAASILGLNPYQSNVDAYLLLTNEEFRAKHQAEMADNLAIEIGNALEDKIRHRVIKEKGWDIDTCEETLRDAEHSFLIGHLDGIINLANGQKEILEIKTRGNQAAKNYGEEGSDSIIDSEYIQCMHYLMITGMKRVQLAVLMLGDREIKYFVVERNEDVIYAMRTKLVAFWNDHVLKRVPPTPLTYEDAGKLWPISSASPLTADEKMLELVTENRRLDKEFKKLKDEINLNKALIAFGLAEHDTLLSADGKKLCTYKTQTTTHIDSDLLHAKYPAIANECSYQSKSRVMRFAKGA